MIWIAAVCFTILNALLTLASVLILGQAREHARDIPREALRANRETQREAFEERQELTSRFMHLLNREWDLPPAIVQNEQLRRERGEQTDPLAGVPSHIRADVDSLLGVMPAPMPENGSEPL